MNDNLILGGLAAAQVVALIGVWIGTTPGATASARPLIALNTDKIERITLHADVGQTRPVVLVRAADGWRLRDPEGLRVDGARVDELLTMLSGATGREPAAATVASHAQLKVDDTSFTRKVVLSGGGRETTVRMGGGRRSFLRVDDSAEVWPAGEASPFKVMARETDWMVQPYLAIEPATVTSVTLPTVDGPVTVARVDGGWTFDPPIPDRDVDGGFVDRLLGRLKNARASGLPEDLRAPLQGDRLSWTYDDGGLSAFDGLTLAPAGEQRQLVRADSSPFAVEVGRTVLSDLAGLTLDKLAPQ
jgi:hypothetical protein